MKDGSLLSSGDFALGDGIHQPESPSRSRCQGGKRVAPHARGQVFPSPQQHPGHFGRIECRQGPHGGASQCGFGGISLGQRHNRRQAGGVTGGDNRLEGAQAGLSWETILKKRASYRAAFDRWHARKIALRVFREMGYKEGVDWGAPLPRDF